jgi:hypothetical protein
VDQERTKKKIDKTTIQTEKQLTLVGFMVYLVSLGFFVDNPSSCNAPITFTSDAVNLKNEIIDFNHLWLAPTNLSYQQTPECGTFFDLSEKSSFPIRAWQRLY